MYRERLFGEVIAILCDETCHWSSLLFFFPWNLILSYKMLLISVHNKPSDLFIAFHIVASAFIVNVCMVLFSTSEKCLKRNALDHLFQLPNYCHVTQRNGCCEGFYTCQDFSWHSALWNNLKNVTIMSESVVVKVVGSIFIYIQLN